MRGKTRIRTLDSARDTDGFANESSLGELLRQVAAAPEYSLVEASTSPRTNGDAPGATGAYAELPRIDGYEVLGEIGRGGMGVVYRARQTSTGRQVAVKVVAGRRSEKTDYRRRFEREIRVLARLHHPRIASLYAAGSTQDGDPFFAMELVDGVALESTRLSEPTLPGRLRLFLQLCDAVAFSHRFGVIHRDLKPKNVLVSREGTEVKVLDFGLAQLVDPDSDQAETLTRRQSVEGTLPYMSPEQVSGQTVTTLSDVYALGVILYELCTGRRPYEVPSGDLREAVRVICEERPRAPSKVISSAPRAKDLDAVVLKALEKEPSRRYQSVAELALDVEHYLARRPVQPRQMRSRLARGWYRVGLFCRRNLVAVGVVSTAIVTLAGVGLYSVQRIASERRVAEQEATEATARLAELFEGQGRFELSFGNFARASLYLGKALSLATNDTAIRMRLGFALRNLMVPSLTLVGRPGILAPGAFSPDGARIITIQGAAARVRETSTGNSVLGLESPSGALVSAAFTPDGNSIVTADSAGFVRMWSAKDGKLAATLNTISAVLKSAELDRSGERLLLMTTNDGFEPHPQRHATVLKFDGKLATSQGQRERIVQVRLGSGGYLLPIGRALWYRMWTRPWSLLGPTTRAAEDSDLDFFSTPAPNDPSILIRIGATLGSFSPDGSRLLVATDSGPKVLDSTTGKVILTLKTRSEVNCLRFSPDGTQIVASGAFGWAVWSAGDGKQTWSTPLYDVRSVAISPGGSRLLITWPDGGVRYQGLSSGEIALNLEGRPAPLQDAVFSPDGARILTTDETENTQLWSTRWPGAPLSLNAGGESVTTLLYTPNGERILTLADGNATLRDATTAAIVSSFRLCNWVEDLSFSDDGTRLFGRCTGGKAKVWDVTDGKVLIESGAVPESVFGVLTRDGSRKLSVELNRSLIALLYRDPRSEPSDQAKNDGLREFLEPYGWSRPFHLAPASSQTRPGYLNDSRLLVHEVATGKLLASMEGDPGFASVAAISPGGDRVLTSGKDSVTRIWDVATGTVSVVLANRFGPDRWGTVATAIFSPDSTLVATAGRMGLINLWETRHGTQLSMLVGPEDSMPLLTFSPDGSHLAGTGPKGTVRIWDIRPETRTAQEIDRLVRCNVPWRFEEGRLVPTKPDESACR